MEPLTITTWVRIARRLGIGRDALRRRWDADRPGGVYRRLIYFGGESEDIPFAFSSDLARLRDELGRAEHHDALTSWAQVARCIDVSVGRVVPWMSGPLASVVREVGARIEVRRDRLEKALRRMPRTPKGARR